MYSCACRDTDSPQERYQDVVVRQWATIPPANSTFPQPHLQEQLEHTPSDLPKKPNKVSSESPYKYALVLLHMSQGNDRQIMLH